MVRSIRPVSAAFFIWGSVMQLKDLWGRARFSASEALTTAREQAQERLIVVAGRDSGLSFGWALGGAVLVETVFDWPGIGSYAVQAATNLDFEPIMGVTLMIGIIFIVLNLVVDLLYGVLDPRIRY